MCGVLCEEGLGRCDVVRLNNWLTSVSLLRNQGLPGWCSTEPKISVAVWVSRCAYCDHARKGSRGVSEFVHECRGVCLSYGGSFQCIASAFM